MKPIFQNISCLNLLTLIHIQCIRNSQAALDLWLGTIFIKIKFLHSMNNNDCMMTCRRKNTRQEMLKLLRKIHISMQGPDITIHTCVIERYIYHYLQMKGYF